MESSLGTESSKIGSSASKGGGEEEGGSKVHLSPFGTKPATWGELVGSVYLCNECRDEEVAMRGLPSYSAKEASRLLHLVLGKVKAEEQGVPANGNQRALQVEGFGGCFSFWGAVLLNCLRTQIARRHRHGGDTHVGEQGALSK